MYWNDKFHGIRNRVKNMIELAANERKEVNQTTYKLASKGRIKF